MGWLTVGLKIVPLILGAINAVERFIKAPSHEKQAAALDMTQIMLAAVEGAAGRDLLNDADVRDAAKKAIDAIVALQNVIAKRAAKQ